MTDKPRTFPASVCADPTVKALFNVRGITGYVVFAKPVNRETAQDAADAINAHYDHGKNANEP